MCTQHTHDYGLCKQHTVGYKRPRLRDSRRTHRRQTDTGRERERERERERDRDRDRDRDRQTDIQRRMI